MISTANAYDLFVIGGQSNALSGKADETLIPSHPHIHQFVRDPNAAPVGAACELVQAREPLAHFSSTPGVIGFPLQFAARYYDRFLRKTRRKVLLVPGCACGAGFWNTPGWREDDILFQDLVARTRTALATHPGSRVRGILWQHGEADALHEHNASAYEERVTALLTRFRAEVRAMRKPSLLSRLFGGREARDIPIIAGGMVSSGVRGTVAGGPVVQDVIDRLPDTLPNLAVVSTGDLTSNGDVLHDDDLNHYSAEAQYELAKRYFDAFVTLSSSTAS